MKIVDEIRIREGGADIFLATQDGKHFGMLRWNEEQSVLGGMTGKIMGNGLASVRPVKLSLPGLTAVNMGGAALFAFLSSQSLSVFNPEEKSFVSDSAKLDAWEAYLAGPVSAKSAKTEGRTKPSDPNAIELEKGQISYLLNQGLARKSGDQINMLRNSKLQVGNTVSGFDAIRTQTAVSLAMKCVNPPPSVNVDRARELLSGVSRPSSTAVMYYGSDSAQSANDRAQAAKAYPLLAGFIADNPIMARAVDSREPLQGHLMERTGLSKASLKRLSAIHKPHPDGRLFEAGEALIGEDALGVNRQRRFSMSGSISLDAALKYLSKLPPDRTPQDDASWMIYHDFLAGCAIPIENALNIPVEKTLGAVKGDWKAFHTALAKSADFKPEDFGRRAIALTTMDALEALDDFNRTAIIPLILTSISEEGHQTPPIEEEFLRTGLGVAAKVAIGESKNIASSLFEMARRYASRIPALMDAMGNIYEDDEGKPKIDEFSHYGPEEFPVLTGSYHTRNGYMIAPLPDFPLMKRESSRLKHCVGRMYLTQARAAQCHLFSIQNEDGSRSFSTVQLSGIVEGNTLADTLAAFHIVQHRGMSNCDPSKAEKDAVAEWFKGIKTGEIPIKREHVAEWRKIHADRTGNAAVVSWMSVLGMEWDVEDNRKASWSEWRSIIGGPIGRAEHPGILWKEKATRVLLGEMSPITAGVLETRAKEASAAAKAAAPVAAIDETKTQTETMSL